MKFLCALSENLGALCGYKFNRQERKSGAENAKGSWQNY